MNVGRGVAEASERPRHVVDVGGIRVIVDNLKDAAVARRVAKERACRPEMAVS